jgi:hypothetical protein
MNGGKSLREKGHPVRHGARHCRRTSAGTAMTILHITTSDSPDGQPWPPPDRNALWVIVRRAERFTLWRAISLLKSGPLRRTFATR